MPNLGTVLKEEIRRLARLEARALVKGLTAQNRKLKVSNRDLKTRVAALEKDVKALKATVDQFEVVEEAPEETEEIRISGKGIRSLRKKFKMSLAQFAELAGVTPASVYNWEKQNGVLRRLRGDTRKALAEIRGLGVREARARLS